MYELTYDGDGYDRSRSSKFVRFIVSADGERRRMVIGLLDDFLNPESDSDAPVERLAAFVVARIRQLVDSSPEEFAEYTAEALLIALDREEAMVALADTEKRCAWRTEVAGAPFCGVPATSDDSARVVTGERLAPTTATLCSSCSIPDEPRKCSALIHPQVSCVRVAEAGVIRRVVSEVYCAVGQNAGDGGQCVPGGNGCWRVSWQQSPLVMEPVAPQAIHEGLDFLALQWKSTIGGELFATVPIEALGGLTVPVLTRDDFKSRMSDLAAVIERMLSAATKPEATKDEKWQGSLNRVEAVLSDAGIAVPSDSLRVLRDVVAVRTGLQHPASRDLAKIFARLQVPVPVSDWDYAWRTIRSQAVSAITELRTAIRDS